MTPLPQRIRARLAHIQQRTKGDNKGVVMMSAKDCDALFDLSLSMIACVEHMERIGCEFLAENNNNYCGGCGFCQSLAALSALVGEK